MQLIPNSFGADLREFNQCHTPGGSPAGGQFCSTDDAFISARPTRDRSAPPSPIGPSVLKALHAAANHGASSINQVIEAGGVLSKDGRWVGRGLRRGNANSVTWEHDEVKTWLFQPKLTMVHTHPTSSPPSLNDLQAVVSINNRAAPWHNPDLASYPLLIDTSVVIGRDGSWYKMGFKQLVPAKKLREIQDEHQMLQDRAIVATDSQTTKQMSAVFGVNYAYQTPTSIRELAYLRGHGTQLTDYITEEHSKNFKAHGHVVWTQLAKKFSDYLTYEAYLAPRRPRRPPSLRPIGAGVA